MLFFPDLLQVRRKHTTCAKILSGIANTVYHMQPKRKKNKERYQS